MRRHRPEPPPRRRRHELVIRAVDLLIVVVAAPVLVPLTLALVVAVWLDSPGPVLYRSDRVGRHGHRFTMYKLRSMVHGAVGPAVSAHRDERYTPLGALLAATRLDELPQLVNVVRGDMRLVGPRPEAPEFVALHPELYAEILSVPPGLTGACQLDFAFEGRLLHAAPPEDRARVYAESILPQKMSIDLEYVRSHGIRRNLAILLMTPAVPVTRYEQHVRTLRGHIVRRPALAGLVVVGASWLTLFLAALVVTGAAGT